MARPFDRHVFSARLRSAPLYRLIPFERLSAGERRRFSELRDDPGFRGLLRPEREGEAPARAIDRETARLFTTLRDPSRLPQAAVQGLGSEAARRVAGLVLDGVLEIEHAGRFVSGIAAHALFFQRGRPRAGRGRVARLSAAALAHAAALPVTEQRALAQRLYRFNCVPASPEWRRRLPTTESVAAFLRLDRGDRGAAIESRGDEAAGGSGGWLRWRSVRPRAVRRSAPVYKLYVTPSAEHLPKALGAAMELLDRRHDAIGLKVGCDLYGVLRPDKLVAYFRSIEDLGAAAQWLRGELRGMDAQGVPFTAALTPDGLLSWGLDPPANRRLLWWHGARSWRSWLAHRLAGSLVAARAAAAAPPRARRFAVDRISLDGVDPGTWTPRATVWADARAVGR